MVNASRDVSEKKVFPIIIRGWLINKNGDLFVRWHSKSKDTALKIEFEYPAIARKGIDEKIITPYIRQNDNFEKYAKMIGRLIPYNMNGKPATVFQINWLRLLGPSPNKKEVNL